jgi:signal transduction histidine kinase
MARGASLALGMLAGAAIGAVLVREIAGSRRAAADARQKLSDEHRDWGLLVRRFAHDLRNPLTAIKARAELMRRQADGRPEQLRHLDALLRAVDRLDARIGDLSSAGRAAAPNPPTS